MIKSRRMSWARYVARMEEIRNASECWSESLKGRDHSQDIGLVVKIILK
jgi:hypothetical protein